MSESPTRGISPEQYSTLADDMRTIWLSMVRGAHFSGCAESQQHRQQHWVLGTLGAGPQRMSDLAEHCGTSQASLTGVIDRLEERGLVVRIRPVGDRRVVEVSLTEAGRQEKEKLRLGKVERLGRLLSPLEPEERLELMRLFRKMTAPADAGSNR